MPETGIGPIRSDIPAPQFLVHNEGDNVAIAVQDVEPGDAEVLYMDSQRSGAIRVAEKIPLGHKVALANLSDGADVTEYGVRVGISRMAIRVGQLVHVHNIRSARWKTST